jgi:hypothetical protein
MISPEDLAREENALAEKLVNDTKSQYYQKEEGAKEEAKRRLLCSGSKVLDYCRRNIPSPEILYSNIQKAVELCADVKDEKLGVFFSRATWKIHVNAMRHVKLGCVSDMPGVNYYYFLTMDTGRKRLVCI